ncbi:hypothetical protein [Actinomadura alba]|uniref:Uncharacterized protein n=1 Tax=Actinomadura alba TaxID=406431 RepID=A0ABR7LJW2_9ACTN|nr:hypothetical protein [Actinomadura alba]MBC6464772.1 hypothetical protein [Actinomadura alba]
MTESSTSETAEKSAESAKALRTQQAQANRQVAKLRAAVRERDDRLRELEERLVALEGSTTYRFGRIVVGAARRPGRRATRLPRELYRLWKHRDAPQRPGQSSDFTRGRSEVFDREEDRLLAASPAALEGSVRQLVIAGVFGPSTTADLAGFARTLPLFPHDGGLVLESSDADLVLVDVTAGAPGGPWAYLGEPGMYDRERTLGTLLDAARGRDLPVVLWPAGRGDEGELGGAATAPGLSRLDWDAIAVPGVSLLRFNPAWGAERDRTPLVIDPGVRLPLGVRRAVDAITATIGARVADPTPAELPQLLRRHSVTVAATPAQVPEQLASGAFVLCPAAVAGALPADLRAHVHVVTDPAALPETLSAVPLYDPRLALRTLFLRHSAPVRLAELCERLGIDADPAAGRRVTVVADVGSAADAARLADDVLAQSHRPAEVAFAPGAGLPGGALTAVTARLAEHGVTVCTRSAGDPAGRSGTATPGEAPWVAPWPTGARVPESHLADLVCAAECSGADAVGPAAGAPDHTFVAAVEPALVRRELYETGGAPAGWSAQGARLMSLDSRG